MEKCIIQKYKKTVEDKILQPFSIHEMALMIESEKAEIKPRYFIISALPTSNFISSQYISAFDRRIFSLPDSILSDASLKIPRFVNVSLK